MDSFLDPGASASLSAILSKLEELDGEIDALRDEVAESAAARKDAGGRGGIISDTSVQYLRQAQESINQQVISYERLNELIEQRIALEREAAAAVRSSAAASDEASAPAPRQRVMPAGRIGESKPGEQMGLFGAGGAEEAEAQLSLLAKVPATVGASSTALEVMTERYKQAGVTADELGVQEVELSERIQAATMAMVDSSTAMTAHGALSTEFLSALAKGQVGFADLGEQVMQTIGKFGGWTIAAAGVYGALDALNQLREGAVNTNSAVTGLTRFIPNLNRGEARSSIITQARQTATPIEDVGNTAQQFAKVFKNQGDVFTATHVALTAAKLDNIDLADSYRYLIALTQEWGLSAQQLPGAFDQITAAQDKLGASVSQLLPAIARSLSAVKNTGGGGSEGLGQLIGLESLGIVRTGQTGSTIGTAFSRGASNFFTNPTNRGILSQYGINPNQSMQAALIEAIGKTGSSDMSGLQKEEISKAFFGPLRGGLLAGLFNAPPKELERYLSETAGGKYPGLANKQLGTVVSEPTNQLKELGVNLQAIGAELGGSGFQAPFGLMLEALNEALKLTGDMLSVWNEIPGPVKDVASTLAVVAGVMATMRRLNIGQGLAESGGPIRQFLAPAFTRNPDKILAANVSRYAEGGQVAAQAEVNRAATTNLAAQRNLARAEAAYGESLTENGEESEVTVAAARRYNSALTRAAAAMDAVAQADAEHAALTDQLNTYQAALREKGVTTTEAASRAGFGTFAAGASSTRLGAPSDNDTLKAAMSSSDKELAANAVAYEATAKAAQLAAAAEVESTATLDAETTSNSLLARSAGVAAGGLAALNATMEASVGWFGAAVAAFLGFEAAKDIVKSTTGMDASALSGIRHATTVGGLAAAYARSQPGGEGGLSINPLTDVQRAFFNLSGSIGGGGGIDAQTARARATVLQAQANAETAAAKNLEGVNTWLRSAAGQAHGSKQQVGDLQNALTLLGQNKALQATDPSVYALVTKNVQDALQKALPANKGGNPFAAFGGEQGSTLANLSATLQGFGKSGQVFGVGSVSKDLSAGYALAVNRYKTRTPANSESMMAALEEAKSSFDSAMQQSVSDMETAAKNAPTASGAKVDYSQAIATINATHSQLAKYFADQAQLDHGNKQALQELSQAEREAQLTLESGKQTVVDDMVDLANTLAQFSTSQITGVGPAEDLARAQSALSGARGVLSQAQASGAGASEIKQLMTAVNQDIQTAIQDKVNYIEQLGQAESQLGQAGTANPVQQAQIAAQYAQQELSKLKASGDTDATEMDQLLATIKQAQLSAVADLLQQWQGQEQVMLTNADVGKNAMVQAQNAVANAQQNLAHVLSLGNKVSPQTVTQAYQTLATANQQMAQEMLQEGQSLIQAQSALAQSGTANPVKIAQAALLGDQKLLQYMIAHHYTMSQIVQQQAQVGDDIKSLTEAKYSLQESTIEFQASTYQITGAQEIEKLQSLYEWMKKSHASVTALQQIYQQIWNLEYGNSGDLNLNTGAMHMPSTYEVKSAIIGGRNAMRRKTSAGIMADVQTNVRMDVTINKDADVNKFVSALNEALGTSVNGLAQAAGLV